MNVVRRGREGNCNILIRTIVDGAPSYFIVAAAIKSPIIWTTLGLCERSPFSVPKFQLRDRILHYQRKISSDQIVSGSHSELGGKSVYLDFCYVVVLVSNRLLLLH